jgi:hypothetical protein
VILAPYNSGDTARPCAWTITVIASAPYEDGCEATQIAGEGPCPTPPGTYAAASCEVGTLSGVSVS